MMKKATALLALLVLCSLAPAAAQEPQEAMAAKAEEMAQEAEGMVEKAEEMVAEAESAAKDDGATLDEVLAAHYEALGGTEAWASVESVRFEGTMSMGPGMEAPFKMTMKRPGMIRLEFTFQGMTGIQAFDGDTAWMVMPFMGKNDPEEMAADMAEQLQEQADIDGPLFDWADKGHQVELLGVVDMEGTEAYKVKLTRKNGKVRHHYLDTEYYVTIKQEGKTMVQGQEMDIETSIGDYKELCLATSMMVDDDNPCEGGAVMVPHAIESKPKGAPAGQAITINTVSVNPGDIEGEYFAMPAAEPAGEAPAGE
jgi:outer membrane lipoprotein-sorting protein